MGALLFAAGGALGGAAAFTNSRHSHLIAPEQRADVRGRRLASARWPVPCSTSAWLHGPGVAAFSPGASDERGVEAQFAAVVTAFGGSLGLAGARALAAARGPLTAGCRLRPAPALRRPCDAGARLRPASCDRIACVTPRRLITRRMTPARTLLRTVGAGPHRKPRRSPTLVVQQCDWDAQLLAAVGQPLAVYKV